MHKKYCVVKLILLDQNPSPMHVWSEYKRRDMVYKFMTQNSHTHKAKSKAREWHFYCCTLSPSHSEAFNMEQRLAPHCKFKMPSTCSSGIRLRQHNGNIATIQLTSQFHCYNNIKNHKTVSGNHTWLY